MPERHSECGQLDVERLVDVGLQQVMDANSRTAIEAICNVLAVWHFRCRWELLQKEPRLPRSTSWFP